MLRITSSGNGQDRVLLLEGKICQQWIGELSKQIHRGLAEGSRIILDFARVSYIDEEAAEMLSRFPVEKLEMKNCTLYIRTLFDRQRRP
jgi:anti-anti-sigma regulatory factor